MMVAVELGATWIFICSVGSAFAAMDRHNEAVENWFAIGWFFIALLAVLVFVAAFAVDRYFWKGGRE